MCAAEIGRGAALGKADTDLNCKGVYGEWALAGPGEGRKCGGMYDRSRKSGIGRSTKPRGARSWCCGLGREAIARGGGPDEWFGL